MDGNYDIDIIISDILLAHEYIYPPNFTYKNYAEGRNFYGIVYVVSGEAEYCFKNRKITASSGQVLFISKNTAYIIENKSEANFHHYTVNFQIDGFTGGLYDMVESNQPLTLNTDAKSLFENLFAAASNAWYDKNYGYKLKCKSCLYDILCDFFAELSSLDRDISKIKSLESAKNYIDKYYARNIKTAELANMCAISTTHFNRLFRTVYKCSPMQYKENIIILKAKDLISCRYYTIKEISYLLGYDDPNYFSRMFKKHIGLSPKEYSKKF